MFFSWREHAAAALGPERRNISILCQPVCGCTYPDGNFFFYNFAAVTPALPPADRQAFYGSFTRDLCDKYLVLFADFKYVRSFFDASLAAVPFTPDPFKIPGTNVGFSPNGISVPIQNPFNPFTVARYDSGY